MTRGGRPFRFLAIILGGWAAVRIAMLLPDDGVLPALVRDLAPVLTAAATALAATVPPPVERAILPPKRHVRAALYVPPDEPMPTPGISQRSQPLHVTSPAEERPPTIPPPLAPTPRPVGVDRLSGSAWLLARGGMGGTLSGGQLGASQAGLRLTYALGETRRLAIAARIAAPLRGRGREAALGLDWQPTRLPIHLIAEHRFVLDGGRGGPTIGVIGGYGPGDIARGLRAEAYGQAGAIARDGIESFVDVAGRITHPIGHIGPAHLDIGMGAWASAQRGAHRIDLGPSLGIAIPIAGRSLRLNLDWRERIGGRADPGSGAALSIGSDF